MAISKRLRYEVLRRDGHRCRYCGVTAADAVITVDAVMPESLGGSHQDPANLVTACESCNGGKSSSHPDSPLVAGVPESALRWGRAIKVVREQLLSDLQARDAYRAQARQLWDERSRNAGPYQYLLNPDGAWADAVDECMVAGVPLCVLRDCMDTATDIWSREPAHKRLDWFCRLARKKAAEIYRAAYSIVMAESGEPAGPVSA